jgi:2-hydroxy-4-carboxymuconate semialdehyde hemiacetal dehydrogenase
VVGPKEGIAAEFASRHAFEAATTSLGTACTDDDVEVVVVASPSPLHAEQAGTAIRNGKHVLVEIPLALSLADGEELVELADRHGVLLGVCHTQRFWEPFLMAQEALEHLDAPVTHIVARHLSLRRTNVGWTGRKRSWTDDLLWHHGGHVIDVVLAFLGSQHVDVRAVIGRAPADGSPPMDYGIGLRTPDGTIATIALSYHATTSAADYLLVSASDTVFLGGGRVARSGETLLEGDLAAQMTRAVASQDAAFLDAVRRGTTFPVEGRTILPTLRIQDAVQRQAADQG